MTWLTIATNRSSKMSHSCGTIDAQSIGAISDCDNTLVLVLYMMLLQSSRRGSGIVLAKVRRSPVG